MSFSEKKRPLGTFRNKKDTANIVVYDLKETVIDKKREIYVELVYQDEKHNALLHTKYYGIEKGDPESPYNQKVIEKTPYFVIEGDVYYLDDIYEIGFSE